MSARPQKCLWCEGPIPVPLHAGRPMQFCCREHRQMFWNALRCVGHERFIAGHVTSTQLREQYGAKAS